MREKNDWIFQTVIIIGFTLFTLACLYPFYYLFLVSISDPDAVARGQVIIRPVGLTIANYYRVFTLRGVFSAFIVSAARTVIGTSITLFFSSMLAYVVTKKETIARKFIYRSTVFTMFVSAGLIPWFITMKTLGLNNSFLLYILPGAVSPFAVVLIKTYIESIAPALEESALIDGAGFFTIFTRIILPLCKPVIAAVAVFSAVGQWNSWQDNFFLVSKPHLQTLQYLLVNYLREAEQITRAAAQSTNNSAFFNQIKNQPLSPFSVRATLTVVAVFPILLVYPFLQRYFVKGIMLGSVKG